MTKKLKDAIHRMLYACYNGNDVDKVINAFLKENQDELYDQKTFDDMYEKVSKNFARHNNLMGSNIHIRDYEGLFSNVCCWHAEAEEPKIIS